MYGLKKDWDLEPRVRQFVLADYQSNVPRWCPGCGDSAVLSALQRLARDEQLPPEKTVVVSGIGCSSRLPHYMKTYGFHGLHGRPLPVACGVRSRRPDLHVFVVTGDGDNCAIGTAHWIHAIRYNMKMTVLLFDNNIYSLTKMQTSPTTKRGDFSYTHPMGAPLNPLDPLSVTLAITNASFVAQTIDWNPMHVEATIRAAHAHPGLSFIRILQRCPHYNPMVWQPLQQDPSLIRLLVHPDGIPADDTVRKIFKNQLEHDPADLSAAKDIAAATDAVPVGLLHRNVNAERYDFATAQGLTMETDERVQAIQAEIDRFLV
ncbi:MAG: 2-oxoglutarate oxidoreductase [Acidobacteriota bacterium]|nr:MAG: 2-oxoglutarate oxidoreductase [Acidobacteriota bacterium]